jgi:hypothetical protein
MPEEPKDLTGRPAVHDGAFRGRRLSWREFYALRPDLQPANDNGKISGRLREKADPPLPAGCREKAAARAPAAFDFPR